MAFPFHVDPRSAGAPGVDEHFIQAKAIALAEERFDVEAFAVPNQGKRSRATGRRFKQEGLRAGVADTVWSWSIIGADYDRRGGVGFIEFKPRDGALSDDQALWLYRQHGRGHLVAVCRHWLTALDVLASWAVPPRVVPLTVDDVRAGGVRF